MSWDRYNYLELASGGHIVLHLHEGGVDTVELAALFRVSENFMSLLNAFEEGIVIGVEVDAEEGGGGLGLRGAGGSLFVRVVFKHFLAVYFRWNWGE